MFLEVPEAAWVCANALAFAFRDRFPVSPGHTLVVTRRVTPDWFSATADEQRAVLALVDEVKRRLDDELAPDGYNVGFNAGSAAGQTVMHLHVHVIPRFRGDMDDPRGGVRHVIPSKGNYLRAAAPLATGGEDDPFARHVLPLFDRARDIAIVAAFVQESGLDRIRGAVDRALQNGARIRIITGDYLNITQAAALETLLDWEQATQSDDAPDGRFAARVIEVEQLPTRSKSFHPKSWRFESPELGVAFVGSSNLSRSALDSGIEWNLRVDRDRDHTAYTRVRDAFEALWTRARPLDAAWIAAYAQRARRAELPMPPGEETAEPLEDPPAPHEVQLAALERLAACRAEGRTRAIVVLATGLGKTWLAAFDHAQLARKLDRPLRLLFVAHRAELLRQAARTFRRLLRAAGQVRRVGWFVGDSSELDADLVFASVAKLARPENLARLATQHFDNVVVDEVHHAAAGSYRRILDRLDDRLGPAFLLGLTTTRIAPTPPISLACSTTSWPTAPTSPAGIELGRPVPFDYLGVKDDIDYENIPWRNRQFAPRRYRAPPRPRPACTAARVWPAPASVSESLRLRRHAQ